MYILREELLVVIRESLEDEKEKDIKGCKVIICSFLLGNFFTSLEFSFVDKF